MKTNKNTNSMYALLLAAAVIVIGNDSVTHKYTMSSVMERCLNTYEDSIPE